MKIELVRIYPKAPTRRKPPIIVDMTNVPRKGECIILGDTDNYHVREVIYRLDDDYQNTGRITVEIEKI